MARLPIVKRDQVPEQFRAAFDEVTAESGGVIASGPGSITINSPEMARRRNHLTSYLRYETTFPKRIQELAIITTARAMDCPYIWNAHAPAARRAGVSDALIDALRERQALPTMSADEAAVVNYATAYYPQLHQWGCSPESPGVVPVSSSLGLDQLSESAQAWALHGGARNTLIDEDMALRYRVPFTLRQLLARFNLGRNGVAFALVFGADSGVDRCCARHVLSLAFRFTAL